MKYFHQYTMKHGSRNRKINIQKSDESYIEDDDEIANIALSFFFDSYQNLQSAFMDSNRLLEVILEVIMDEDFNQIIKNVTIQEFKETIFSFGTFKAPHLMILYFLYLRNLKMYW